MLNVVAEPEQIADELAVNVSLVVYLAKNNLFWELESE